MSLHVKRLDFYHSPNIHCPAETASKFNTQPAFYVAKLKLNLTQLNLG